MLILTRGGGDYSVDRENRGSREDFVTKLTTSSYYTGFKDSAGKASGVVGTPTLEQFKTSYNAVNTDTSKQIDILYCTKGQSVSGIDSVMQEGYVLRFGNTGNYKYSITIPSSANKKDLYIITDDTKAAGMWLASYSAYLWYSGGDTTVMLASSANSLSQMSSSNCYGIRPLVTLNSGVKLVDPDGDGVYDLQ